MHPASSMTRLSVPPGLAASGSDRPASRSIRKVEAEADKTDIELGTKTREQVMTERTGGDFDTKSKPGGCEENAPCSVAARRRLPRAAPTNDDQSDDDEVPMAPQLSATANPWVAQFANEPALVAPIRVMTLRGPACARGAGGRAAWRAKGRGRLRGADPLWRLQPKRLRPYVIRDGVLLVPVKRRAAQRLSLPVRHVCDRLRLHRQVRGARPAGPAVLKGIALHHRQPGRRMVAGNFDLVDHLFTRCAAKSQCGPSRLRAPTRRLTQSPRPPTG